MFKNLSEWSAAVKERDGKCMECGSLEHLHAHHVQPRSLFPELKLSLENGRTLCYGCHKRWHEQNRPPRVRSGRPQRKTLQKMIDHLSEEVSRLEKENRALKIKAARCDKGHCKVAMRFYAKLRQNNITP